jgi:DNA polymerase-3 subunit delta
MDSLSFLDNAGQRKLEPVYVLHGDEDFLKRQIVVALRALAFGGDGDDFGFSSHAGDKATFAAVVDELETTPFLGSKRLVLVENADPFVTRHRSALEAYVVKPHSTGTLVLDVRTWPATTRLAKLVKPAGTITCKAPPAYKLPDWCIRWAASRHEKQLGLPAARLLVDLVGTDMGQLDQELGKLAVYAGKSARIDARDVDTLIGHSREESIFKAFDAVGARRAAEAFDILDGAFEQGEDAMRLLGAFSMQLRRLARAASLVREGKPAVQAVEEAGFPPFGRQAALQQLRVLGTHSPEQFFDWLLETDQGLKGYSELRPRQQIERLLVRLVQRASLPPPAAAR